MSLGKPLGRYNWGSPGPIGRDSKWVVWNDPSCGHFGLAIKMSGRWSGPAAFGTWITSVGGMLDNIGMEPHAWPGL